MQIKANLVLAFTDDPRGGNPAGVVLNDAGLTEAQMQRVAAELGYSETAFVQRQGPGFRIEFFTPTRRIANCGHATVATFAYLQSIGLVGPGSHSLINDLGQTEVDIRGTTAAMKHTTYAQTTIENPARVLATLGVDSRELISADSPFIASTGNRFVLAHLKSEAALAACTPQLEQLSAMSEEQNLIGAYLFCTKTVPARTTVVATARMFAPHYGIPEESATGMAAAPLAFYLKRQNLTALDSFIIFQGDLMQPQPRHAEIHCEFNREGHLFVGGSAVVAESRTIEIG